MAHYAWKCSDRYTTWDVNVTSGPTRDEAVIAIHYDMGDVDDDIEAVAVTLWDPDVEGGDDWVDNITHLIVRRQDVGPPTVRVSEREDGGPSDEWTRLWQNQG